MLVIRFLIERLLGLVFALVGTATLFQGLGVLVAAGATAMMAGRTGIPSWLVAPLIQGGCLCAVLLVGGAFLSWMNARSAPRRSSWRDVDDSLQLSWTLPALLPTLVLPVVAAVQSRPLLLLWQEMLAALSRFVSPADFRGADEFSGLALFPIMLALFLPALEAIAALSLIFLPPFLLPLQAGRSHTFRVNARRTVVVQTTLVVATLVGAHLLSLVAALMVPHILKAGGPESVEVLRWLRHGQDVLWGTAKSYAGLALVSLASFWVLIAGQPEPTPAFEVRQPEAA